MLRITVLLTVLFFFSCYNLSLSRTCNELVCGSVVSKCMLTQSCNCNLKSCTCCRKCFSCLGNLYSECCGCVDMCGTPNATENENLSTKSHVEELEGIPNLFEALTEEQADDDLLPQWTVHKYPVDFDAHLFGANFNKQFDSYIQSGEQDIDLDKINNKNVLTINCTVIYLVQCMSWNKCRESCQSMGANSYRWFHDGCCECVGETCINYGINESRCLECPENKMNNNHLTSDKSNNKEEDLDFGEGVDYQQLT